MKKNSSASRKGKLTPRQIVKRIAEFAEDKKAEDISVLDMRKVVNFCDFFLICSGNTDRQVRAIADGIEEGLDKLKIPIVHKQGRRDGRWIIFDLGDTVVHVFQKEARDFYRLDYLWQEAKLIKL